jgi:hypothetical protein
MENDKLKLILDKTGYDFNYQIEESHVLSLMQQAYNLGKDENNIGIKHVMDKVMRQDTPLSIYQTLDSLLKTT